MTETRYEPSPLKFAAPGESWAHVAERFPQTGLWPVFFDGNDHRDRPWQVHTRWKDEPRLAAQTLREQFGLDRKDKWDIQEDDYCFECGAVTDRSGELSIGDGTNDLVVLSEIDASDSSQSPALVRVEQPSDCLAELGRTGACNAGMFGADACVVLRSWQERFGAYVYSAFGSHLELLVTRPPVTVEQARLVAREHFHFCRYDSQFHGVGGIAPYVSRLVGNHRWCFWRD